VRFLKNLQKSTLAFKGGWNSENHQFWWYTECHLIFPFSWAPPLLLHIFFILSFNKISLLCRFCWKGGIGGLKEGPKTKTGWGQGDFTDNSLSQIIKDYGDLGDKVFELIQDTQKEGNNGWVNKNIAESTREQCTQMLTFSIWANPLRHNANMISFVQWEYDTFWSEDSFYVCSDSMVVPWCSIFQNFLPHEFESVLDDAFGVRSK